MMDNLTFDELKELAIKRGVQAHDLLMENSKLKEYIKQLEIENQLYKNAKYIMEHYGVGINDINLKELTNYILVGGE